MGEVHEAAFGGRDVQPGAVRGAQQAGLGRVWVTPIAVMTILLQGGHGAGVQEELSGLAELSAHDGEGAVARIEVIAVQAVGFARPHTGHGEQPNQGLVGQRGASIAHPARGIHQCGYLVVAEQVGHRADVLARQQICRRNLVNGIESVQVKQEAAYSAQPQPVPVRAGLRAWLPRRHGLDGHARDPLRVEIVSEVQQQPTGRVQLVPQRPTHLQVPLRGLAHRTHRHQPASVSGQGRTSAPKAPWSILA
jgi:hypothetical protein